jgi:glutathione synthase/RimK-type ligase-like ATP-grasp enzyme
VIGYEGNAALANASAFGLAIAAAQVLHADLVGISIVKTASGLAVWDVDPVPDFRSASSTGSATVADAIANYVVGKFGIGSVTGLIINAMEVQHDVVAIC